MNTNKTKQKIQVKWPKGLFTIAQLQTLNAGIVNITLRFKINKLIDDGKLVAIGKNVTKMGRPTKVFGPSNVSVEQLDAAKKRGIILEPAYEKLTTVASAVVADFTVKPTTPKATKTPKITVTEPVTSPVEVTDTVTV